MAVRSSTHLAETIAAKGELQLPLADQRPITMHRQRGVTLGKQHANRGLPLEMRVAPVEVHRSRKKDERACHRWNELGCRSRGREQYVEPQPAQEHERKEEVAWASEDWMHDRWRLAAHDRGPGGDQKKAKERQPPPPGLLGNKHGEQGYGVQCPDRPYPDRRGLRREAEQQRIREEPGHREDSLARLRHGGILWHGVQQPKLRYCCKGQCRSGCGLVARADPQCPEDPNNGQRNHHWRRKATNQRDDDARTHTRPIFRLPQNERGEGKPCEPDGVERHHKNLWIAGDQGYRQGHQRHPANDQRRGPDPEEHGRCEQQTEQRGDKWIMFEPTDRERQESDQLRRGGQVTVDRDQKGLRAVFEERRNDLSPLFAPDLGIRQLIGPTCDQHDQAAGNAKQWKQARNQTDQRLSIVGRDRHMVSARTGLERLLRGRDHFQRRCPIERSLATAPAPPCRSSPATAAARALSAPARTAPPCPRWP